MAKAGFWIPHGNFADVCEDFGFTDAACDKVDFRALVVGCFIGKLELERLQTTATAKRAKIAKSVKSRDFTSLLQR